MTRQDYIAALRQYKEAHADQYGIQRIGIFGSVARGEQTADSDVDVCVQLAHPDLYYLVHIKDDLENLFNTTVDVVRLRDRMDSLLRQNIERDGIYA